MEVHWWKKILRTWMVKDTKVGYSETIPTSSFPAYHKKEKLNINIQAIKSIFF